MQVMDWSVQARMVYDPQLRLEPITILDLTV